MPGTLRSLRDSVSVAVPITIGHRHAQVTPSDFGCVAISCGGLVSPSPQRRGDVSGRSSRLGGFFRCGVGGARRFSRPRLVVRGAFDDERGNNTIVHHRFYMGCSTRVECSAAYICVDRGFRFHSQRAVVHLWYAKGPQGWLFPLVVFVSVVVNRAVRSVEEGKAI